MENERPAAEGDHILPIEYGDRLKVMSIGLLLPGENEAVIWRGPDNAAQIDENSTE